MLKKIGLAFGAVFVVVGLLGFVPAAVPEGKLLGVFAVNGAHNIVHLATGIIALGVALAKPSALSMFFKVFGVVYALVAVLGYFSGDQPLLGVIAHNMADLWLHAVIAAVSLWIGFGMRDDTLAATAS
jgi:hypothetical protein